jgi:hypothetical protein
MVQWRERRALFIAGALILVCIGAALLTFRPSPPAEDLPAVPDTLPAQLSNEEFWQIVEDFSEPNGYFRSDNLLSNESGLQDVIPKLKERIKPGGVYIGVGPEQNFTYVLAFEPKVSFVVDIRRLNLLEHLLYKALFELSQDRADFVSRLFSRPRPKGLTEVASAEEIFAAFDTVREDNILFEDNLSLVLQHLMETHGFGLSEDDRVQIRYVFSNFYQEGPDMSYSFLGSYYQGTLGMPTYRQLMTSTDTKGRSWSFLATENQFRRIQEIQRKNLIVPLVGDFAGPKALRAVGQYMTNHHAVLSVFYTSNVEMYLFQQGDDWKHFYDNVATMPANSASAFIRFAAGRRRRGDFNMGFSMRSQMWSSVRDVIAAVRSRGIDDYGGILGMSD